MKHVLGLIAAPVAAAVVALMGHGQAHAAEAFHQETFVDVHGKPHPSTLYTSKGLLADSRSCLTKGVVDVNNEPQVVVAGCITFKGEFASAVSDVIGAGGAAGEIMVGKAYIDGMHTTVNNSIEGVNELNAINVTTIGNVGGSGK
jgi:hypothetical protein